MDRCVALINESHFLHNLAYLQSLCPNTSLIVMAKANAYGHGLKAMTPILSQSPIWGVGVASLEEALILRKNGFLKEILLFDGGAFADNADTVIDLNITPMLCSIREAKSLKSRLVARKIVSPYKVHLKIDTGFYRCGLMFDELLEGKHNEFLQFLHKDPSFSLEGFATHFACADIEESDLTNLQVMRMSHSVNYLMALGIRVQNLHIANSSAILRGIYKLPKVEIHPHYLVRSGLSAYGIDPIAQDLSTHALKPVLSIKAQIVARKTLKKGHGVGYGQVFYAEVDKEIALISIGYGDGFKRNLGKSAYVLLAGIKAPIIGNISMDSLAVDLSEVIKFRGEEACRPGMMATLLGEDQGQKITASMLAKQYQTIPFEILTSIADRVPRVTCS